MQGSKKRRSQFPATDSQGRSERLVRMLQSVEQKGAFLSLPELLALAAGCVLEAVPYDCIIFYGRGSSILIPQFSAGVHSERLSSATIPWGQGMSGWVAANAKPILNGNPSVDCADLDSGAVCPRLKSALAIPLGSGQEVTGVLTVLREAADAFSQAELQQLFAIRFALGRITEAAPRDRTDLAGGMTLAKAV